jgi:hypothetical protein
VNEREVVGPFSLVTNEQPAEEVVPTVGSLDDPSARLSAHTPDEWLFASPSNVAEFARERLSLAARFQSVHDACHRAPILQPRSTASRARRRFGQPGLYAFSNLVGNVGELGLHTSRDHAALRLATFRQVRGGALNRLLKKSPRHLATDWLPVRRLENLGKFQGRSEVLSGGKALRRVFQQPVRDGWDDLCEPPGDGSTSPM